MAEITWTDEANNDLDGIAEFISRDSPFHAWNVTEETLALAEKIPDQPRAGRMVPELEDPDIRERLIYSYRLVYRILHSGELLVVTVIHSARLLNPESFS